MSTDLTYALGAPRPIKLGGKTYVVEPIDLNDLVLVEQRYGSVDDMTADKIEDLKFLLWLFMRKADPALTAQQREAGDYQMTEHQAAKSVTLEMFRSGEVATFVRTALINSGLIEEKPAKKTTVKKQRAAGDTNASSPS